MIAPDLAPREIGRSGIVTSVLGLGCNSLGWRADVATSIRIVRRALDCGITFFDTADVYGRRGGSEELLGQGLGRDRARVVIATKFGAAMHHGARHGQASRNYIETALEGSLGRLRTDWVDLYQLHWHDPLTPIGETLDALEKMRRAGKIRAAGCCNLTLPQYLEAVQAAADLGIAGFVSLQAEYSAIARDVEAELLPALIDNGAGLVPYFPLAGGLLTGKYDAAGSGSSRGRLDDFAQHRGRFLNDAMQARLAAWRETAAASGMSLLSCSLRWLASRPGVATIIAGASTPDQVSANARALGSA